MKLAIFLVLLLINYTNCFILHFNLEKFLLKDLNSTLRPFEKRSLKSNNEPKVVSLSAKKAKSINLNDHLEALRPLGLRTLRGRESQTKNSYDSGFIKMLSAQNPFMKMNMPMNMQMNMPMNMPMNMNPMNQMNMNSMNQMNMNSMNKMNMNPMNQMNMNPMNQMNMNPMFQNQFSNQQFIQTQNRVNPQMISSSKRRANNTLKEQRLKLLEDQEFLGSKPKLGQFIYAKNRDTITTTRKPSMANNKRNFFNNNLYQAPYMNQQSYFNGPQKVTKSNVFKLESTTNPTNSEEYEDEDYEEKETDKTLKSVKIRKPSKVKLTTVSTTSTSSETTTAVSTTISTTTTTSTTSTTTTTTTSTTTTTTTTTTTESPSTQAVFKQSEEAKSGLRQQLLNENNLNEQEERIEELKSERQEPVIRSLKFRSRSNFANDLEELDQDEQDDSIESDNEPGYFDRF